jgi:hypothetical protein
MMKSVAVVSLLFVATPALAASGDAWAEFAKEVEQGCLAATSEIIKDGQAVVDPFGSETYGMALVSGEVSPGVSKTIICVFDKKSKAVEIGGELDVSVSSAAQ